MNKIPRQFTELLVISNYRKLYQLKGKSSIKKTFVKSIKKLSAFILLFSFLLLGCKDEKAVQIQNKKEDKTTKSPVKESKTTGKKVILFYGNSLTAGYGLDPSESFPSNIESIIDSLELEYNVVNAGLSGETTSGGLKRLDWVMKQKVDVFVLELGANDMLRGLPLEQTRENLAAIIDNVKEKEPGIKVVLCEMMAAPNMGKDYVDDFQKIYKDLAQKDNVTFLPFFLEGVAGNPELLLQDGKHPNAKGQVIVAQNVWNTLKEVL